MGSCGRARAPSANAAYPHLQRQARLGPHSLQHKQQHSTPGPAREQAPMGTGQLFLLGPRTCLWPHGAADAGELCAIPGRTNRETADAKMCPRKVPSSSLGGCNTSNPLQPWHSWSARSPHILFLGFFYVAELRSAFCRCSESLCALCEAATCSLALSVHSKVALPHVVAPLWPHSFHELCFGCRRNIFTVPYEVALGRWAGKFGGRSLF